MRFVKMQGIGNDFVMVDGFDPSLQLEDPGTLSRRICDRHYGVGADGLIVVEPAETAQARMRVFNADGTEAEMCGNGLRCAAQFLKYLGRVPGEDVTIETGAGLLNVRWTPRGLTADMGAPHMEPREIPVKSEDNRVALNVEGRLLHFFCVSMGNPHAVTFDLWPDGDMLRHIGRMLEYHPVFPHRANIEFCRIRDGGIDVRVWERGDGATLGCGTGACAVLTAAASLGLTGRESEVHLPGGILHIRWADDGHLYMTGPARVVFAGDYPLDY